MIYVVPLSIRLGLYKYLYEAGYHVMLVEHYYGVDAGKRLIDRYREGSGTLLVSAADTHHVNYILEKEYPVTVMAENTHRLTSYTVNGNPTYLNLAQFGSLNEIAARMEFKYKPSWMEHPSRLGVVPYWEYTDTEDLETIRRRIEASANDWFPRGSQPKRVVVNFFNDDGSSPFYFPDEENKTVLKTVYVTATTEFESRGLHPTIQVEARITSKE